MGCTASSPDARVRLRRRPEPCPAGEELARKAGGPRFKALCHAGREMPSVRPLRSPTVRAVTLRAQSQAQQKSQPQRVRPGRARLSIKKWLSSAVVHMAVSQRPALEGQLPFWSPDHGQRHLPVPGPHLRSAELPAALHLVSALPTAGLGRSCLVSHGHRSEHRSSWALASREGAGGPDRVGAGPSCGARAFLRLHMCRGLRWDEDPGPAPLPLAACAGAGSGSSSWNSEDCEHLPRHHAHSPAGPPHANRAWPPGTGLVPRVCRPVLPAFAACPLPSCRGWARWEPSPRLP